MTDKLKKYFGEPGCNSITKFYTFRRTSNSRNTGCEIINRGGSTAVSGRGVIVNLKLERNLIKRSQTLNLNLKQHCHMK